MKKIPVTILGSTGLVGQHFVRLLADHPVFEIAALSASERSAGRRYGAAVDWQMDGAVPTAAARLKLLPTVAERIRTEGSRVVFSALPAAVAGPLEVKLRAQGCFVFSNASSHRHDSDVPLLVAEVNPEHLALVGRGGGGGFIVCGPNCSTAGLALALRPLRRFGLRQVTVTTLQALSGAGRRGVAALAAHGNVVPYIPAEEEKMAAETVRLLGALWRGRVRPHPLAVRATCCRVGVLEGHLQSVTVELEEEISAAVASRALAGFRGAPQRLGLPSAPRQPLLTLAAADRPQPRLDAWAGEPERARGMAVPVGRLRLAGRSLSFLLLVHNLVRGAAGGCLLNAELAQRTGRLAGAT